MLFYPQNESIFSMVQNVPFGTLRLKKRISDIITSSEKSVCPFAVLMQGSGRLWKNKKSSACIFSASKSEHRIDRIGVSAAPRFSNPAYCLLRESALQDHWNNSSTGIFCGEENEAACCRFHYRTNPDHTCSA